jgi:hypothetical protein
MLSWKKLTLLGISSISLTGCVRMGASVLGESNFSVTMHNPSNNQEAVCAMIKRGEINQADVDELSRCVAAYAAKGFVVDTTKP